MCRILGNSALYFWGLVRHMLTSFVAAFLAATVAFSTMTPSATKLLHRRYRNGVQARRVIVAFFAILFAGNLIGVFFPARRVWVDVLHIATFIAMGLLLIYAVRSRISVLATSEPLRILAVGAHPDDLEIACGGTLARLADEGHVVHAMVMSDGQVGGDAALRPLEAVAGAAYMGIVSVKVHTLADTRLAEHNMDMVRLIEAKLKDFQPDVIFTHSAHDHHQDHEAVHHSVLRAARRHPTILCFESPSVTREFNPSFFVDICDHVDVKVHAIEQHKDQSGKPYMGSETVRGIASFRGSQAKRQFVEAFEPVRVLGSAGGRLS